MSPPRRTRPRRPLLVEPLEPRRLLAPVNVPVNGVQDFTQTDPALIVHGNDVQVYFTGTGIATSTNQGQSFVSQFDSSGFQAATAYDPIADQDYVASVSNVGNFSSVLVRGSLSTHLFPVSHRNYRVVGPAIAADSDGDDQNVYVLAQVYPAWNYVGFEHAADRLPRLGGMGEFVNNS